MNDNCQMCSCNVFTCLGKLGPVTWLRCRACGWDQELTDDDDNPTNDPESTD